MATGSWYGPTRLKLTHSGVRVAARTTRLIQILLEAREGPPDVFRPAQIRQRVGD